MWETICDAQAGFCTHSSNSKFLSKFSRKPIVEFQTRKPPPPPENEKVQISDDQSLLQNTPPPKLKFSHFLALWVFSVLAPYPPSPENWNLAISWHFEYFQFWHPPPQLKFSHFLALWVFLVLALPPQLKFSHFLALWVFSVLAPSPPKKNWNLAISCHFEYFQFWHLPPPPKKNWNLAISWHFEYFQFLHHFVAFTF